MYSAVPMRIAKIGHIVLSGAIIVLASLLLAGVRFPFSVWIAVCGALLILFGAVKITGYASKDLYRLAFQYDLVFGCVLAGVGLVFLIRPNMSAEIAGVILGLVVFSDGVIKIQVARHARSFGITLWWLIMVFAALASVDGLIVATYPWTGVQVLTIVLGVTFLIEGVMSACTVLTSVRVVEYREREETPNSNSYGHNTSL